MITPIRKGNGMKKIDAYKADDGFVSEDVRQVEEHEKQLAIKALFDNFVEAHCWSGMSKSDISDTLYEHRTELIGEIAKTESIHKKK
jgi:hypothetical protein